MKILKNGNIKKLQKVKCFYCSNCGCVWEANKDEYQTETCGGTLDYICKCPFEGCGEMGRRISESRLEEELGGHLSFFQGEKVITSPPFDKGIYKPIPPISPIEINPVDPIKPIITC